MPILEKIKARNFSFFSIALKGVNYVLSKGVNASHLIANDSILDGIKGRLDECLFQNNERR